MAGRPHYDEYETEEDIKILLKYYDDMIRGDGFHYLKWEKIDKPPIEWLKKEVQEYSERLKNLYSNYKRDRQDLKRIIGHYKSIISSNKEA